MPMKSSTSGMPVGALIFGAALVIGMSREGPVYAAAPTDMAVTRHASVGKPEETTTLSIGAGQMIRLAEPMSDLFVADDKIADVQVRSPLQLYVFGKGAGETAVYATNKAGKVLWSSTVRVGANITSVDTMLKLAMPDAAITATTMNGLVLLSGTVAAPTDIEEAQKLVEKFVGEQIQVVNRLKSATPLQVSLHVKIAEVSREFAKNIGVNLLSRDQSGGFLFGIGQGDPGTIKEYVDPNTDQTIIGSADITFKNAAGATTLGFARHMLGLDLLATLDLAENDGLVTTLAQPNLTAMSGETASFLAGGEIPIPLSTGLGAVSVEFKQYGVSLSFTPTVLAGGRISLRVRPEVSQLSSAGSVKLNGYTIPGISTRRAETTVELGSGQSFMIGGLMSNGQNNTLDKAPFLGDLPVLGALFRSSGFKRNETELMIVITPYLVKPVSPNQIALPTDGFRAATDPQRVILGQTFDGKSARRPGPATAPARTMPAQQKDRPGQPAPVPDAGFSLN